MFPFDIFEVLLAYDHNQIRFLKAKEAILNGDANDKKRGNQNDWTWLFIDSTQGS